jgi:hypothetical protein
MSNTDRSLINFATFMIIMLVVVAYISSVVMWYNIFVVGQYYAHCSVLPGVFFGLWPIIGGAILYFLIKYIIKAKQSI